MRYGIIRNPKVGSFILLDVNASFIKMVRIMMGKFDPWKDEGMFIDYSNTIRSYRVFNKCTLCI